MKPGVYFIKGSFVIWSFNCDKDRVPYAKLGFPSPSKTKDLELFLIKILSITGVELIKPIPKPKKTF